MDWSVWKCPAQWPPQPHGYTWLMDAAERIAAAVLPEWAGKEFGFEATDMALNPSDPKLGVLQPQFYSAVWFWHGVSPRPLTQVTPPSTEKWIEAYSRWRWCFENADGMFERKHLACIIIHKAAERGELVFHARNETTGEMVEVPRARWNCDTNIAMARISRGRINLMQPMALEPMDWSERQKWLGSMTSWLFVPNPNLSAFIKGLSSPSDGGSSDLMSAAESEAEGRSVLAAAPELRRVRGWVIADAELVTEMRRLVLSGDSSSPTDAAKTLVKKAKGSGTVESKVRRLERRYYETHPHVV